jgi:hypothetical protein
VKLRELAHSRTGDKGDVINISVIAYHDRDYARIREQVTVDRVRTLFAGLVRGDIVRYEVATIGALNFVLHGALDGGVTRSLRLDPHGKSLGSLLLDLEIS